MHPATTLISDSPSRVRAAISGARPYTAEWPHPAELVPMMFRMFDDGQLARIITGHTATVTMFTVAPRPEPAAANRAIHLYVEARTWVRLEGPTAPGRCRQSDCATPDRCAHTKWATTPLCHCDPDTIVAGEARGSSHVPGRADDTPTVQEALDRVCNACCVGLCDLVDAPTCRHLLPRRLCLDCGPTDDSRRRPAAAVGAPLVRSAVSFGC